MGKIKFLPGYNCAYYSFGHCLYEEHLNPGYQDKWQCRVLAILENDYDSLMHQAEKFDLSFHQFESIWEKRFRRHGSWEDLCRSYIPGDIEDDRCIYLCGNACILMTPDCPGVCRVFKPQGEKDIET